MCDVLIYFNDGTARVFLQHAHHVELVMQTEPSIYAEPSLPYLSVQKHFGDSPLVFPLSRIARVVIR